MPGHELIGKLSGFLAAAFVMAGGLWLYATQSPRMSLDSEADQYPVSLAVREIGPPVSFYRSQPIWYADGCEFDDDACMFIAECD